MNDAPRGIRNNNPGNLRHGQPWEGLSPHQTDPDFCQFTDAVHGIRALCIVILAYRERHGLKTLRSIIARWAPAPDHNDPTAYALTVAKFMRVGRDDVLDVRQPATLAKMATGIIRVECADYTYDPAIVNEAVKLAYSADDIPAVLSPASDPRREPPEPVFASLPVAANVVTTDELNRIEASDPAAMSAVAIEESPVTVSARHDVDTEGDQ